IVLFSAPDVITPADMRRIVSRFRIFMMSGFSGDNLSRFILGIAKLGKKVITSQTIRRFNLFF
ncbi:MAG: hypothetical protein K2K64_04300, partial [Muribaculaceae bacterium]|nr:hypothetical protein [Muribaculaceae bacterium]